LSGSFGKRAGRCAPGSTGSTAPESCPIRHDPLHGVDAALGFVWSSAALPLAEATCGVIVNARQADAATACAEPNRTILLKLMVSRTAHPRPMVAHDQTNPSTTLGPAISR